LSEGGKNSGLWPEKKLFKFKGPSAPIQRGVVERYGTFFIGRAGGESVDGGSKMETSGGTNRRQRPRDVSLKISFLRKSKTLLRKCTHGGVKMK